MRSKIDAYAHMLTIQARMAYPIERPMFENSWWSSAHSVLDFGTGNGAYLRMLQRQYPEKRYTAIERDAEMAARARKALGDVAALHVGEALDVVPPDLRIDFLIARLVCLYLPDRTMLQRVAEKHKDGPIGILIIDADDEFFQFKKEPPKFRSALEVLRRTAVNRNLRHTIRAEWERAGYTNVREHRFIVNSDLPNMKPQMFAYMWLSAEMAVGAPLTPEIAHELFDWLLDDDSYVQYGVFGSLFVKDSKMQ